MDNASLDTVLEAIADSVTDWLDALRKGFALGTLMMESAMGGSNDGGSVDYGRGSD